MAIWAASDLHLDEDGGARLFDDERQGRALERLCARVLEDPAGELVLLGDTFDLTSMLSPARGLDRFASALDVPLRPPPARTTAQLLAAVARSNPRAFAALRGFAARAPLSLVPGNHDRHLAEPGAAEALAAVGLGAAHLVPAVSRTLAGRRVLLEHGHRFDRANARPDGGGETMTRVLHQAVVPYLRAHGARRNVRMDGARVVALRPEESVVPVLERWLRPEDFRRFFRAFLQLLGDNGYLPRPSSLLARLITPEQVRKRVEQADRLWEKTGEAALRALAEERGPDGTPVHGLVLGHTHILDWAVQDGARPDERFYVNLGTWTERAQDASGPLDVTLPALELRADGERLTATLRDLAAQDGADGPTLQRFESAAET